jgi:hypothetical protein
MIVTPAQAGVQFESTWIPACAGMTNRYHAKLNRKFYSIFMGHRTRENLQNRKADKPLNFHVDLDS